MSELTCNLRRIIQTHDTVVPENLILSLLDELEVQQGRIDDLTETINNQYKRHGNQIAELRREIGRLKGVHGA